MKDSAIQFPTTDRHRHRTKTGFHAIRGFPSVISAVDGTINVQASCDHRGVFTSINAIWPGSTHDAHVFRTSELFHFMETHHHGLEDGILLGDRAYPCKPYMLTPYLHPVSKIVICCVVLHNLAKLWGEPEEFPPEDDQQPPTVLNHDEDMSGKAVREYITMQYFRYELQQLQHNYNMGLTTRNADNARIDKEHLTRMETTFIIINFPPGGLN
ncbi:HARB1-like protein [Mya arenaria]|uniref:HARB1-like protein n=1 Tax=Mya arenaria TaxID=6604 RepID=A0ABY7F2R2_MYAAR|nr:HARB1-like protein [Mya arenaria]